MAESQSKLEITAKVVDLGDKVIQLQHVVSAGRDSVHPFRPLGAIVIAIGLGLIGTELATRGFAAFKLQAGGSLPLWLGFAAAGVGLFLVLFARRQLMIRTSDGARIVLPTSSDEAAAALVMRMRQAMEAAGASVSVAPAQGAIAGGAIEVPALTPRTGAPLGLPQQSSSPPTGRPLMTGDPGLQPSLPGARRPEGYANGHGGQGPFSGSPTTTPPDRLAGADNAVIAQRRSTTGINPTLQVGGGAGGGDDRRQLHAEPVQKQAPREPLALPATLPTGPARDDGPQDLAALIEHVRRSDVQHKDALIDLLRVVEDFYRGRGSREDAVAHWRSFADYVVQYLGDVDGLIAQTERFGRHMLAR